MASFTDHYHQENFSGTLAAAQGQSRAAQTTEAISIILNCQTRMNSDSRNRQCCLSFKCTAVRMNRQREKTKKTVAGRHKRHDWCAERLKVCNPWGKRIIYNTAWQWLHGDLLTVMASARSQDNKLSRFKVWPRWASLVTTFTCGSNIIRTWTLIYCWTKQIKERFRSQSSEQVVTQQRFAAESEEHFW